MKKNILILVIIVVSTICVNAQIPDLMNYQAIARTGAGNLMANANIGIQITITDGSGGTVLYQERHFPTTNQFGLFTLSIGSGTVITGTFSTISWESVSAFMQVEMDPAGGSNYTTSGISQLLSVPYALYSSKAITSDQWNNSGSNLVNTNLGNVVVGLGVTTTAKLNVGQNVAGDGIKCYVNTSSINDNLINAGSNVSGSFSVRGSGDVGIGVLANPEQQLSVQKGMNIDQAAANDGTLSSTSPGLRFGSNSSEAIASKRTSGTNQYGLDFYTGGVNRMTITNGGRIGIGTITPGGGDLEIGSNIIASVKNVRLNTSANIGSGYDINVGNLENSLRIWCSGTYIRFGSSADAFATTPIDYLAFEPGVSFHPYTDNSMSLGISTNRWTAVYAVNGTIQTSDISHKKNIKTLSYGLKEVLELKPVSYQWKDEKNYLGTGVNLGFIAQELEKVVPDAVVHTINQKDKETGNEPVEKDSYGIKYSELVPVLVNAIQEQQAQIEKLNSKIGDLQHQIILISTK
ncbi:MAG: tail fiber domain-containing protein [Bacteroidota bacterium]